MKLLDKKKLCMIALLAALLLFAGIAFAQSWPSPGHPASQVGGGIFNGSYGNFIFPTSVNVTVNGSLSIGNGSYNIGGLYPMLSIGNGRQTFGAFINASMIGLYVRANTTYQNYTIRGETKNATDDAVGSIGEYSTVHGPMGVYGKYGSISAFLTNGTIAVYGNSGGVANAYAGYFKGDTVVTSGNLYSNNMYGTLPTSSTAGAGYLVFTPGTGYYPGGNTILASGSLSGSSGNTNGSKIYLFGATYYTAANYLNSGILFATGATSGDHSIQFADSNNVTTMSVNPNSTTAAILTINKTTTGEKQSLLSVDQMALSQLNGGAYFGRVGIKENQWGLNNYGQKWYTVTNFTGLYPAKAHYIAMSSDGRVQTFANYSASGSYLYVSTDYGRTWTQRGPSGLWYGVAMSSDGKIQSAANWSSYIYVSTDYGITWNAKGSTGNWQGVAMSSDGKIQAATYYNDKIYLSYDFGNNWNSRGINGNWLGIAMSSDGRIQTAINNSGSNPGQLYISFDFGNTWKTTGSSGYYQTIAMSGDGKIQLAPVLNLLYISTDYGNSWVQKGGPGNWLAAAMSSDGKIQVVTNTNGFFNISTDYGNTWLGIYPVGSPPSAAYPYGVAMSSDGKIMTVGEHGWYLYVMYTDGFNLGSVGINTSNATSTLTVNGNVSATDICIGSGTCLSTTGGGPWSASTGKVYLATSTNYVGIGTTSPASELQVNGSGGIDITPINPTFAGNYTNNNQLSGVFQFFVSGKYAYLAAQNNNSIGVIDISNPLNPLLVSVYKNDNTLGGARQVFVSGRYAYVTAHDNNSLTILDVSNPANLTYVGNYSGNAIKGGQGLYVSGKYAYVAATDYTLGTNMGTLVIVDVSNPSRPVKVGNYSNAVWSGNPFTIFMSGKYVYMSTENNASILIFDVSNPSNPVLVGNYTDRTYLDTPYGIYVSGRYAYVTSMGNNTLNIIDISNASKPTLVSRLTDNSKLYAAFSVVVSGKYAYVTAAFNNSIAIIDVSNASNPYIIGRYENATYLNWPLCVVVAGKYLYTDAYNTGTFTILELPGMDSPTASIGDVQTSTMDIADNANIHNNLYVDGSLNVGPGGISSDGNGDVKGYLSVSGAPQSYQGFDIPLMVGNGTNVYGVVVNTSKYGIYSIVTDIGGNDFFTVRGDVFNSSSSNNFKATGGLAMISGGGNGFFPGLGWMAVAAARDSGINNNPIRAFLANKTVAVYGNTGIVNNTWAGLFDGNTKIEKSGSWPDATAEKESLLSVDQMSLSQLNGGAYFGRVGIKENQWGLNNYATSRTNYVLSGPTQMALSSDGRIQSVANSSSNNNTQAYVSTDYGKTWVGNNLLGSWLAVAMSSDGKIIAAINFSSQPLYISTDYGNTWTLKNLNISGLFGSNNHYRIAMSSDGKIQAFVMGNTGAIYMSKDFGNTWSVMMNLSLHYFNDVAMSSDGKIITIADKQYGFQRSYDYGQSWSLYSLSWNWDVIRMSSDGKIQAGTTENNLLYLSRDYGTTWTNVLSGGTFYTGLGMSAEGKVMILGNYTTNGGYYISTDYGSSWTGVGVGDTTLPLFYNFAMNSDGKVILISTSSGLAVSYTNSYTNGNVGIGTSNAGQILTIYENQSGEKESLLSVDNMQLSQLNGGAYFGRVGIKENQWGLNNYGNTWTAKAFSGSYSSGLSLIAMSSDGKYQTVTNYSAGNLFVSQDYGQTWVTKGGVYWWSGVSMSSDGKIQLAGVYGNGNLYRSTDYGSTWAALASVGTGAWLGMAVSSDGKIMLAANNSGYLYTSTDYGNTWTAKTSAGSRQWQFVGMSSDGKIQITGVYSGYLYISYDYGNSWGAITSLGTGANWLGIAMSSDGKIQFTANDTNSYLYVSTDYGNTWKANSAAGVGYWFGVAMSADGKIMAAGTSNNGVLVSADYGNTWVNKTAATGARNVAMSSDGKIMTATNISHILVSYADSYMNGNVGIGTSNAGQALTIYENMSNQEKEALLSTDQMQLSQLNGGAYFGRVGIKENQWGIDNNSIGRNWTTVGLSKQWAHVAMSSDGRIQTAGDYNTGYLYVSADYGQTWTQKGSTGTWNGVAMSSDGKIQTASNYSGYLYVSTDYGNTWTAKDSIRNWAGIAMSSDGKTQIASSFSAAGLYVSTDYGNTWTNKGGPTFSRYIAMTSDGKIITAGGNLAPFGVSYDYGNTWVYQGDTSTYWWGVAMSSDGKIQTIANYTGRLYVSSNYGSTWTATGATGNWESVAMSSDGRIQIAVNSSNNLYVSNDYGATWTTQGGSASWYSVAMSSDGKVMTSGANAGYLYVSYADSTTNGIVNVLNSTNSTKACGNRFVVAIQGTTTGLWSGNTLASNMNGISGVDVTYTCINCINSSWNAQLCSSAPSNSTFWWCQFNTTC